jgi:hypothetical protein
MSDRYILNGHTPVKEPDLEMWATWYEQASRNGGKGRRVAMTYVYPTDRLNPHVYISTVFLALDHNWAYLDGHLPILFETMIFVPDELPLTDDDGEPLDEWQERYVTWEQAEAGHKIAVELVHRALGRDA